MPEQPGWCSRAPGRAVKPGSGRVMGPGLINWAPHPWHSSHPLLLHLVWLLLGQPLVGVRVVPPVPSPSPGSALPQSSDGLAMQWPWLLSPSQRRNNKALEKARGFLCLVPFLSRSPPGTCPAGSLQRSSLTWLGELRHPWQVRG